MKMMMGQQMTAGSLAGTCISTKGGPAICLQASAGYTDGMLRSNSILMRVVPASEFGLAIKGEEATFPVKFDTLAEFQKKSMSTMCYYRYKGS